MSWIRKSPFAPHEDVVAHLVVLLCREAENSEIPFSPDERRLLAYQARRGESVGAEFEQRTKKLIEQLLEKEQSSEMREDPKNFGNSLEWAEPDYPNIVALTEDVVTSGASRVILPRLHGWKWVKDRAAAIGCALAIVLLMLLIVGISGALFDRK